MLTLNDAFKTAVGHMEAGRSDEAKQLFRVILQTQPEHAPTFFLLAALAFQSGDAATALSLTRKALVVAPAMPEALHNLAVYAANDAHSAALAAQRSFLLRPDNPASQARLIESSRVAGRSAEAYDLLSRYAAAPVDVERLLIRAEARAWLGLFEEAAADYLEVLRLQPNHAAAYEAWRDVLGQMDRCRRIAARFRDPAPPGPGDQANIYIKCYSRPMYLDRCLRSMRENLTGYGKIILLNDGIGPEFMEPLLARHPDVEVRRSPKLEAGIVAAPTSERLQARKQFFRDLDYLDPGRFWVREIAADPNDYIIVFEEDCWFYRPFPVDEAVALMRRRRIPVYAVFYENAANQARRRAACPSEATEALAAGALPVELHAYPVDPRGWPHNVELFPIANTLFDRDYWLNSYEGILHWTDERHVLNRAARLTSRLRRQNLGPLVGHVDNGVVRHCQSSTARTDAGGRAVTHPIDPYVFNNLLNRLWVEDKLDVMAGYPGDLPEEYLIDLMSAHLPAADIAAWRRWRSEFLTSYWFYNQ